MTNLITHIGMAVIFTLKSFCLLGLGALFIDWVRGIPFVWHGKQHLRLFIITVFVFTMIDALRVLRYANVY